MAVYYMDDSVLVWLLPSGVIITLITILAIWCSVKRSCVTRERRAIRKNPASTMVIIGSGGHTAEMLRLLKGLGDNYSPRHYVVADSDGTSVDKIIQHESELRRDFVHSMKVEKNLSKNVVDNKLDMGVEGKTCFERKNVCSKKLLQNQNVHEESKIHKECKIDKDSEIDEKYRIHKIPRSREVHQSFVTSISTSIYASFKAVPLVYRLQPELILCNGPGTCVPICLVGLVLRTIGLLRVRIVYVESLCRVTSMSLSGKICYYLADDLFVQWPELLEQYSGAKYIGQLV